MSLTSRRDSNSFDNLDALIDVPESSRKKKVVRLGAKVLETKKEVRKVLPEEKYVDNLEKIIVRDYFPELPKMKAQAEFLEAVSRNDHLKIRELQIRYSTRRTDRRTSPSQRPKSPSSVFDPQTPGPSSSDDKSGLKADSEQQQKGTEGGISAPGNPSQPYANVEGDNEAFLKGEHRRKKKTTALDGLTVQKYLEKYTSEDNASFEELFELHHRRERVKNSWMYEAERKHNESLVHRGPEMIMAADEQLVAKRNDEGERPVNIDNWTYKARNIVLFNHLDEAQLTMAEHIERAKSQEMVINREATRFKNEQQKLPHATAMARAAFQNVTKIAGHVDVTGKQVGVEAKTIGLVATPTPAPDESPLMTWGEIEGTPFRLDAPEIQPGIEDAPTFRIPEMPLRERVAQGIAEQIASRYHNKRKQAMDQIQQIAPKTPKFNSSARSSGGRLATMSPAARSLLNDRLGIRLGTDKVKVSPSPKGTPARTLFSPAIYRMVKVKSEPTSGSSTPKHHRRGVTPSAVTDDLLRIPNSPGPSTSDRGEQVVDGDGNTDSGAKRPSAADFF